MARRGHNKGYVNAAYANKRPPRAQGAEAGSITFCRHGNCYGWAERISSTSEVEFFLCARCTRIFQLPVQLNRRRVKKKKLETNPKA